MSRSAPIVAGLFIGVLLVTGAGAVRDESEWPREFRRDGASLLVFQPQVDTWPDLMRLEFRAVVGVTAGGSRKPVLGAFRFVADTRVNVDTRDVLIGDIRIVAGHFPSAGVDEEEILKRYVEIMIPENPLHDSLDRLLAGIERTEIDAGPVPVLNDPPVIHVSDRPALLLLFDGAPLFTPAGDTDLLYAVNASWDIFFDTAGSRYYLLAGDTWLASPAIDGAWAPAGDLPPGFLKLPPERNWTAVRRQVSYGRLTGFDPPRVLASRVPAELIVIDGLPKLEEIPGTTIRFVRNTESDLFLNAEDGRFYFLVSGRWFRAADLEQAWSAVGSDLPGEFGRIPPEHPRAGVLASVPGTPQAYEAILLARLPRTAGLHRIGTRARVDYDGEPRFEPIAGTAMHFAVNTDTPVIRVGDLYYLCFRGVWFASTLPTGPWSIAAKVPDAVYSIPPGSPVHHATYVRVYDANPEYVVVGHTAGYYGIYVWNDSVVRGTGHHYRPYVDGSVFFPRPSTYGSAARYNRYTGRFERDGTGYGPYAGYGPVAAYNPYTGIYARGGGTSNRPGGTADARGFNPWTGSKAATRRSGNPYEQWGRAVVERRVDGRGGVVRTGEGDLYAGRDDNVYRRDADGWSIDTGGDWRRLEPDDEPAGAVKDGLNRDARVRSQGARRQERYRSWNRSRGLPDKLAPGGERNQPLGRRH